VLTSTSGEYASFESEIMIDVGEITGAGGGYLCLLRKMMKGKERGVRLIYGQRMSMNMSGNQPQ
jgi:hypothetical protein